MGPPIREETAGPWAAQAIYSMQKIKLISFKLCPFVQRTLIVLLEKKAEFTIEYIDLNHKPDWFLRLSPRGKVPVLEVDGRVLFESSVICEYIDEVTPGSLHPDEPFERARHRSWIEFASSILNKMYTLYSTKEKNIFDEKYSSIQEDLRRLENELESFHPSGREEGFFMLDAVYATVFIFTEAFETSYALDFLSSFPKLSVWKEKLLLRGSVKNCVPKDFSESLEKDIERLQSHLSSLKNKGTK